MKHLVWLKCSKFFGGPNQFSYKNLLKWQQVWYSVCSVACLERSLNTVSWGSYNFDHPGISLFMLIGSMLPLLVIREQVVYSFVCIWWNLWWCVVSPGLETNHDKSKCQQQFDNYKECKKREVHLFSPILSSFSCSKLLLNYKKRS